MTSNDTEERAIQASTKRHPTLTSFDKNTIGRDFVVGDIHGMFRHLELLLDEIHFDGEVDRLFSVGDLVDRGPDSSAAADWLARPWFHAVRGNHEQFALDSEDPEQLDVWLRFNGGEWWADMSEDEQIAYRSLFSTMPFAMEVQTDTGTVGIVHADVPPLVTWERFLSLLETDDKDATFYAMWSRNRIQGSFANAPVRGRVDRIYCGHTPIRSIVEFGNVCFIDTGAVYSMEGYEDARLSVIEIQPTRHREYSINTNRPLPE
ncbi:MAG: metallophosphoesterase [Gammaproteobacteria bacterium]|nr:metallophosphoesterase [Gammaproteobacteria bacterium]